MSRVNVWWRMHPADFAVDTATLTLEQIAVYVIFQNQYWRTEGNLPTDDPSLARLARISTPKWKGMRPVIQRFFTVDRNGRWCHERLDDELAEARHLQQVKRESGSRGGRQTQANAKANAQAAAQANASNLGDSESSSCLSETQHHHRHHHRHGSTQELRDRGDGLEGWAAESGGAE